MSSFRIFDIQNKILSNKLLKKAKEIGKKATELGKKVGKKTRDIVSNYFEDAELLSKTNKTLYSRKTTKFFEGTIKEGLKNDRSFKKWVDLAIKRFQQIGFSKVVNSWNTTNSEGNITSIMFDLVMNTIINEKTYILQLPSKLNGIYEEARKAEAGIPLSQDRNEPIRREPLKKTKKRFGKYRGENNRKVTINGQVGILIDYEVEAIELKIVLDFKEFEIKEKHMGLIKYLYTTAKELTFNRLIQLFEGSITQTTTPTSQAEFCSNCGAPLERNERFCGKCGSVVKN
jgi:hypothetical protein